jgi:aminoglycoside phosphotransferase (APT) family kinase protein
VTDRSSDRALDAQRVARVVSAQFPELRGSASRRLGSGWDHELFVLGDDECVFRFPKRAERVPWLLRELEIVGRVAPVLGGVVPRFDYLGAPSEEFPYPFVGYRFVRGVEADGPLISRPVIAEEIGTLLAKLHGIDPAGVPPTPVGREDEDSVGTGILRLLTVAALVGERLADPARRLAAPYLSGDIRAPATPGPATHRLCHNDMSAEHLIVDPRSGRIVGLIDWTDAMVTDPVVDFVGLITVGHYGFISDVAAAYASRGGQLIDASFWERLVWWCRTLTLTWLGEALEEHPSEVGRHIEWVERAFAEPDITMSHRA